MTDLPTQPDGSRWLTLDENTKYAYIVGFLKGMFLGHCFTTWEISGGQGDDTAWQSATDSYSGNYNRFVAKTKYHQFFDGLNKLYADQDNLKIELWKGMWVVMNEISGKSNEEMKSMIEASRQIAAEESPTYKSTFSSPRWPN